MFLFGIRVSLTLKEIALHLPTLLIWDSLNKVFAIVDEDLKCDTENKTSAVHFLRFELDEAMIAALKNGAAINMGIDHQHCQRAVEPVSINMRNSLLNDLQ